MAKIRPIQQEDNVAIAKIIRHSLSEFGLAIPGTAYFDKELDHLSDFYAQNPQRQYFIITADDGKVLGGNGIAEYDLTKGVAELQKLYLDDAARGKRLSYPMLDTAIDFARSVGYQRVYLETQHNLQVAIHLYERYGFKELARPLNGGEHSSMDRFYEYEL